MPKIQGLAAALILTAATLLAGPAGAELSPAGKFVITNDAHKVVECSLLVDSHTRTLLKVHMGKAYRETFGPNHLLQLACMRGAQDVFGPLKAGVAYRFVDAPANRVDVVETPAG